MGRVGRGAFTLLEMVVVFVLLGLAMTLTLPASRTGPDVPAADLQAAIDGARRVAVHQARAVTLAVERGGRWTVAGGGTTDSVPLLTGTLAGAAATPLRLHVSPLGACLLEIQTPTPPPMPPPMFDPVRCRLEGSGS